MRDTPLFNLAHARPRPEHDDMFERTAPPDPKVSIVLPTYNGARHLHEAIASCVAQTYSNWELIIVDDASTDETPSIAAAYATTDDRITLVRNAANKRLPASLNVGFALASGDFLTWTSDDNLFRPNAIAEMVEGIRTSNADVLYADYAVIDEHGAEVTPTSSQTAPIEQILDSNVVGPCFLYIRDVHLELRGYAEDLYLAEDYDFWLRASCKFRFKWLRQNLYLYRVHPNSLTATRAAEIRYAAERCLGRNLCRMTWLPAEPRRATYRELTLRMMRRGDRGGSLALSLNWMRSDLSALPRELLILAYIFLPVRFYRWLPDSGPWQWMRRTLLLERELQRAVPFGKRCVLIDEGNFVSTALPGRVVIPFTAREGVYWGPPDSDETAVQELEAAVIAGVEYVAIAWPAHWWLTHFASLRTYLEQRFREVLRNDRVIVFQCRRVESAETVCAVE
jgi:glycosyltransferase involved in cell wall biosynthesis